MIQGGLPQVRGVARDHELDVPKHCEEILGNDLYVQGGDDVLSGVWVDSSRVIRTRPGSVNRMSSKWEYKSVSS